MIEWKHKKIEDTCDIMVQANSVCVYLYWPAMVTQIRHKKGKMC